MISFHILGPANFKDGEAHNVVKIYGVAFYKRHDWCKRHPCRNSPVEFASCIMILSIGPNTKDFDDMRIERGRYQPGYRS